MARYFGQKGLWAFLVQQSSPIGVDRHPPFGFALGTTAVVEGLFF